jgi:hypothetical protein
MSFFLAYLAAATGVLDIPRFALACSFVGLGLGYLYVVRRPLTAELDMQENQVYGIVFMLPILCLYRAISVRLLIAGVAMYCVVDSAKRGALITSLGGVAAMIAYEIGIPTRKGWYRRVGASISSTVAIVGLACAFLAFNPRVLDRFASLASDQGSGRTHILEDIWRSWLHEACLSDWLIGRGLGATTGLNPYGALAHNDFLELLVCGGAIGLGLYISCWLCLVSQLASARSLPGPGVGGMVSGVAAMWLLDGMYQQFFNSIYAAPPLAMLGFFYGYKERVCLRAHAVRPPSAAINGKVRDLLG